MIVGIKKINNHIQAAESEINHLAKMSKFLRDLANVDNHLAWEEICRMKGLPPNSLQVMNLSLIINYTATG